MDPGFPRKIHPYWPSIFGKVDAAFELSGNGQFYKVSVLSVKHFPLDLYACFSQQAIFTSSADQSPLSLASRKDVCCALWTLMLGLAAKNWKMRRKQLLTSTGRKCMTDYCASYIKLLNKFSCTVSKVISCHVVRIISELIHFLELYIFNIFENISAY